TSLELHCPVLPSSGSEDLVRRLFEPLGYESETRAIPLDERSPAWGQSRYVDAHIRGTVLLSDLLSHLYVLLPVLDDDKHYWVGDDEVDKLLRHGERWLASHPERDTIVRRYLRHQRGLTRSALEQLVAEEALDSDAEAPARAHQALAGLARLPRHAPRRLRRRHGRRGDRASRSAASLGLRARHVRVCAPADRRAHHAQRRVQREV